MAQVLQERSCLHPAAADEARSPKVLCHQCHLQRRSRILGGAEIVFNHCKLVKTFSVMSKTSISLHSSYFLHEVCPMLC